MGIDRTEIYENAKNYVKMKFAYSLSEGPDLDELQMLSWYSILLQQLGLTYTVRYELAEAKKWIRVTYLVDVYDVKHISILLERHFDVIKEEDCE